MFLFFGITPKTKRYGFVQSFCDVHGGRAQHELSSYRSWFKLFFFLALFPVGRERHLLTCSECGAAFEVAPDEAAQLAARAQDIDVPMAGGMGGFGGGLLGQIFGGRGGGGATDERSADGRDRFAGDPYPPESAHQEAEEADDTYRTTPRATPEEPLRIQSKRLDRGA